ncbi:acetoacetate--CoA ligase [bacterium]|nr:MAG: acetoacetate--CoA ligase [bacterium]
MHTTLWEPSSDQYKNCNLSKYISFINENYNKNFKNYDDLYNWSIDDISNFWDSISVFSKIKFSSLPDTIYKKNDSFIKTKWFEGAKLNFSENLLKYNDDSIAIEYFCENKIKGKITYKQLYNRVSDCAYYLESLGIKKGDRVAGFMPNIFEAIIAMLATSSIGAVWSSCSPDFGINGVLDRFSQINPKVLFVSDGYFYKGKKINLSSKINQIKKSLPSVKQVVCAEIIGVSNIDDCIFWNEIPVKNKKYKFKQVPFSHPLYVMYSSGTTGKPKSIVHSVGGTLIQHMKELILHTDLKKDDKIFYFTTCGWMMWNWLVSSLSIGATIVLYDGNPFYPNEDSLLNIADSIGLSIFGTSAKYISYLEQNNINPSKYQFNKLRSILSTGSPLNDESYDFVYNNWKKDIQLCSISGGTDIISCFALGNPLKPIIKGKLQSIGLGMNVKSFDSDGNSLIEKKGELVCINPFPSMPIYFYNDKENEKYKKAYFNRYSNVWHHGDYISIYKDGTVKIFGRSDTTLNPGGVRIGTAEIYRVLDKIKFIHDSVVVGFDKSDDEVIILFIKIDESKLSEEMIYQIKKLIRINCSPRHVPYKIFKIDDIPYTINGKKVELAVKNTLEGRNVTNLDALSNPESLNFYKKININ